jgi:hypothetical protein
MINVVIDEPTLQAEIETAPKGAVTDAAASGPNEGPRPS